MPAAITFVNSLKNIPLRVLNGKVHQRGSAPKQRCPTHLVWGRRLSIRMPHDRRRHVRVRLNPARNDDFASGVDDASHVVG